MNTDNNRKAMADAKAKTEAGVKQKMRKKPSEWKRKSEESSEQSNQGMTEGGEWEVYDFQIRGGSLKNYNPQAGLPQEGEFNTLPGPNQVKVQIVLLIHNQ